MNAAEHLLTCLAEEGVEVAKDCTKALRFGVDDRNVEDPTGPTNRERLIAELNDLMGVVSLLVQEGILPPNWQSDNAIFTKRSKVVRFMDYARGVGALSK